MTENEIVERVIRDHPGLDLRGKAAVAVAVRRALRTNAQAEVTRITKILDQHLPTVIVGLQAVVKANYYKNRDELTPEEVGARAALSAAHWIAKDIATGGAAPLYDLPSVLDLMGLLRDARERVKELENN